jgi:hypothetical protein
MTTECMIGKSTCMALLAVAWPISAAAAAELSWKTVEGVRMPVPPSEYPRLYLQWMM